MKILMVAPQPFFEPRGTPFSVLSRLQALSKLGHEVDLVTYHIGQDVSIPGVTIFRTPPIPFIKRISIGPSLVKLLLDGFLLVKVFILLLKYRYDLLHSHEEAGFFNIFFAKWFKMPHLYDMHSSLPQQLHNYGFTKFSPLIRTFSWFERRVLNASHAIITICPALEKRVEEVRQGAPQVLIENMVTAGDPCNVPEEEVRLFRQRYSLEGKKVILYIGTFEPYQGLDLLMACAKEVVGKIPEALFLLMGGTSEQVAQCRDRVRQMGISGSFSFTGMKPSGEMPRAIRVAHVLVSPRISGTNTPLKIYGYLQSGKPIVATNLETHTQVLNSRVACLVAPEPHALAQGILSMLQEPDRAKKLGHEAKNLFDSRFNFQTFLEKTEQAISMAMR